MTGLFAGAVPADGENAAADSRGAAGKDGPVEQKTAKSRGRISQTQIDTVTKRAEARKQRDEKMKVRSKNVRKKSNDNSTLFRSSK
jgi:hypothetical protein